MKVQRVYNIVFLLINLIGSTIFMLKVSKNASNNMGQNLSRKLAAAKRILVPDLSMSKNSEQIHAYIGQKFEDTVKILAHLELQDRK